MKAKPLPSAYELGCKTEDRIPRIKKEQLSSILQGLIWLGLFVLTMVFGIETS